MTDNLANNAFYTFAAKATPWPNDNNPPDIDNSVSTIEKTIPLEMLFGKYIPASNRNIMASRYDWTSGVVYPAYDIEDINLFTKDFFVHTVEAGAHHVFKCLNNNNGAPSTQTPLLSETSADDVYYATADGYQWKYMYSFDSSYHTKFSTADYIPVVANSSVTANAVSGAIETYKIDSPGGDYNSVTNGYFTDIAIGGNSQYFGLQGPDTTVLTVSANTFAIGEVVSQTYGGITANGVVISRQTANSSARLLTLRTVNNIFVPGANIVSGATSGNTATLIDATSPDVSSNNNFYNGCSLYIISGTGAGQIGTISDYLVISNSRRVLLANAFTTLPDLTSKYIVSPRVSIDGDGTGASALSVINPSTKQLTDIRVIARGSGYTYANVAIFGNTGSTAIAANNAVVRAVLPPRGGHGFDPVSELGALNLCYSTTFANTENNKLSGTGSKYRRVGLIVNPQYANVLISYTYSTQPTFTTGTTVRGSATQAYGKVSAFYSGNNTIKLSNVSGIFASDDVLTSFYSNGAAIITASSNVVANTVTGAFTVFNNRTLLVCPTSSLTGGVFTAGQKVVQTEGGFDNGYAYIESLGASGANTLIYLTEVNGLFQASDSPTNTYKYIYNDANRQVRIQIDDVVAPDMVPYTGDILYVENIEPVTRNSSQSETIKLIYGFN
jgi:hypothetical protein